MILSTAASSRARHYGASRMLTMRRCRGLATQKTFDNQSKLPRLPVPDLEATAERYKRSLLPLLNQQEYQQASAKVDRFVNSDLGKTLQERLYALDKREAALGLSWIDRLWLDKGYLEYRAPSMINVNWWNQFQDPPQGLSQQVPLGMASEAQLQRSAGLITELVKYSNRINEQAIPPDVTRSGPFCMHQLKGIFGTSRIARMPKDTLITSWPATAQHVVVMYKDQFFKVPVFDGKGHVLSLNAMQNQLHNVVSQVDHAAAEQLQPPVGIMTSENRDTWAKVRQKLESNAINTDTLHAIDTSLFVVCLDYYSSPDNIDKSHRNMFHGQEARNRWFDKSIQLIVENNGRAGVNGEHSPVDAIIPFNAFNHVLQHEEKIYINPGGQGDGTIESPTWLTWNIDIETGDALREAQSNAANLINDMDSLLLQYSGYGSNFMKKAKSSPDGWMQMVYQLAYYRQYGKPCPTYESASTRKFLTGRTETVRSCSVDTVAFTKAWEDKDVKMTDKLALLQKAITSHMEYMKAASNGTGVDRHLLGLRCHMTPEEAKLDDAAMFSDPSFAGSQYWLLSTSNISPGDYSHGGFGAVVPEGYGLAYAISKESSKTTISSWHHYTGTDSATFRKTIRDVLDEFGDVAERYLIQQ